jgi:hypothetical protein
MWGRTPRLPERSECWQEIPSADVGMGGERDSLWDRNDLPAHAPTLNNQPAQADRQLEPPRPRATRIEINYALTLLLLGYMTMSVNDNPESRRGRFQVKLRQVVKDVQGNTAELHSFSLRQLARPRCFVDIAANRRDRRNLPKLLENLRRPNVSRMNDLLRPAQSLQSSRSKPAMSVGNNPDQNADSPLSGEASLSFKIDEVKTRRFNIETWGTDSVPPHKLVHLRMRRRITQNRVSPVNRDFRR